MIWVRSLFDNIIWWHFTEIELSETQSMWDVNAHFWIVPASQRWKVLFLSINVSLLWFCFMQLILFLVAAHSYSKCLHVDNNAECPIIMCELTEPASVWLLYLISIELSVHLNVCVLVSWPTAALWNQLLRKVLNVWQMDSMKDGVMDRGSMLNKWRQPCL